MNEKINKLQLTDKLTRKKVIGVDLQKQTKLLRYVDKVKARLVLKVYF